jgi:hypothetical protein
MITWTTERIVSTPSEYLLGALVAAVLAPGGTSKRRFAQAGAVEEFSSTPPKSGMCLSVPTM